MSSKEWRQGITATEEAKLFRRVAEGKKSEEGLKVTGQTDGDRRRRLEAAVERGTDAAARLAAAYRTFTEARAGACHRSMGRRFELDELKSFATIALYPLLRRYRPELGVPFTGFASDILDREIKRMAYSEEPLVGGNRTLQDQIRLVKDAQATLEKKHSRPVSCEEIAEETGLDADQVRSLLYWKEPESIDALQAAATGDDRHAALPEGLIDDPRRGRAEGLMRVDEARESIQDFFDWLLEGSVCTQERRLLRELRHSATDKAALIELRDWQLDGGRSEIEPRQLKPLNTLQWRLLVGAIGRSSGDTDVGRAGSEREKRTPAHPLGTGALERRARRIQVVEGRRFRAIR